MKRLYTHITDIAVTTKRWELSAPAANAAATEEDWIWSTHPSFKAWSKTAHKQKCVDKILCSHSVTPYCSDVCVFMSLIL